MMKWPQHVNSYCRQLVRFIRFVILNFINDDCTYRASALAFTSLLAVVPLMTVGLAILSSFPVFQGLSEPLQDFIFQNFVPATGKIIQSYLQIFSAQVSKLSIWGLVFLFVTALLVMFTIEQAMNKIWRVSSPRHGVAALLLYWAILSLAPILLGLSLAASSYLVSSPFFKDHQAPSLLLNTAPYLLSLTGFTFLYAVVPNHPVKFKHAFFGAIVATLFFETAKLAFVFYLIRYNTYELLYGAFASLPLFFIWVYWVWFITLLGAEVSYAFSVHYQRRSGEPIPGFIHALLWLQALWVGQQSGRSVSLEGLIDASSRPFASNVDEMLSTLVNAELIHRTETGQYMLSQDMGKISLYMLSQKLPYPLPSAADLDNLEIDNELNWQNVFTPCQESLKKSLAINLEQLFSSGSISGNHHLQY